MLYKKEFAYNTQGFDNFGSGSILHGIFLTDAIVVTLAGSVQ